MENYLYQLFRFYGLNASILFLAVTIIGIGILHAFLNYEKKAWLKKLISNGNYSDEVAESLMNAVETQQKYPIYKYMKFSYSLSAALLFIIGVLTIFSEDIFRPGSKWIVFIPLVYGLLFFAIYKLANLSNNGLWRELTAVFLFSGFAMTFLSFFETYGITFLRNDIQIYIVLAAGLYIVNHFKSYLTSYLYMIGVILAAFSLQHADRSGLAGLEFLKLAIWGFALASLHFWLPIIKEVKKIELREIIFGALFMIMFLSIAFTLTYGLAYLYVAIMLPGLYLLSKVYFKNAVWYLEKPVELIIILFVLSVTFLASNKGLMIGNPLSMISYNFGFMQIVSWFILIGLSVYVIIFYKKNFKDNKEINMPIIIAPFVLFIAFCLGNDFRGDYLVFLYGMYLGVTLLLKGLNLKNEIHLLYGSSMIVTLFFNKLKEIVQINISTNISNGLYMISLAVLLGGFVYYLRSVWTVTQSGNANDDSHKINSDASLLDNELEN